MKRILLSLVAVTCISQSLSAKDILTGTNYCKQNMGSFIADNYEFENQKKTNISIVLNIESNREAAIKNLSILTKKPYNEEAFINMVNILKSDRNPNNFTKGVKPIDSLTRNPSQLDILFDSMIWLRTNEAKEAAIDLVNAVSMDQKLSKNIKTANYRNYMSLKNIGYFQYQTEAEDFFRKIDSKIDKKDIIYKEFYELMEGNLKTTSLDEKELAIREKALIKSLATCYSDRNISSYNSKFTPEIAFGLFINSKLFPKYEEDLRALYYAGAEKTNLWELMEYFYQTKTNNLEKASKLIELIFNLEGKPNYLRTIAIKTYQKTAFESFNYNKYYLSWTNSLKALQMASEINDLSNEDLNNIIEIKKILKGSATKLIELYTSKHEAENANYIYATTDNWLNKIFVKKVIPIKK